MGTTSEKLTYLNTTKTLIKEELNLGGANISTEPFRAYSSKLKGIYKDFLAHGVDVLWNNWEKVSGTGETLSLTPTIKGKMKVDLKGNTQQNGTPTPDYPQDIQVVSGDNTIKVEGKNLVNTRTVSSPSGLTITRLEDGRIKINGTISSTAIYYDIIRMDVNLPIDTYTFSVYDNSGNSYAGDLYLDNNYKYKSTADKTFTTTAITNEVKFSLYLPAKTYNDTIIYFQLEKGSTASSYQPYQSTTYPISLGDIELCKIGTYQDSIAKSSGKNLMNYADTFVDGITTFSVANVKPNKTYYCKAYNVNDTYTSGFSMRAKINGVWTAESPKQLVTGFSYTTPANCTAIAFNGCTNPSDRVCMVNEGTTALPYEPYGKVWYLNKQIGKVVLDGSESGWTAYQLVSGYYSYYKNYPVAKDFTNLYCISDYFTYYSGGGNVPINNFTIGGSLTDKNGNMQFNVGDTENKLNDFKTWLGTHNTTAYYPLATPTNTEITDSSLKEQLNNLENAMSYDSQTNISQTNDDMPFELDITALKEMS